MEIYQENLIQAVKLNDKPELASALLSISSIESHGELIDSLKLEYTKQALLIYKELDDREGIAKSLNRLGSYYLNEREYETSLDYYTRIGH